MFPRQIRPDRSPCGVKYYPNTALFDQIFNFGGSCTYPFTDQGQIWYARVDHGVLFHIKFHLKSVHIIIYNHTQPHKFEQFWNFQGLLYQSSFANQDQIWHTRAHLWSMLTYQISSGSVYCVTTEGQKISNFTRF